MEPIGGENGDVTMVRVGLPEISPRTFEPNNTV